MTGRAPPTLHRARYFAATDALGLLSSSGPIDDVRELAKHRARLAGKCSIFRIGANGITLSETVYPDGVSQLPLFQSLTPEVSDHDDDS